MARQSFKDQLRQNDAATLALEAQFGDLRAANGRDMPSLNNVAAAKARGPRKASTEPSEAQILKAIMQLLHRHPKVARAWRQNSGVAQYESNGKTRYVRANTAKGMSDISGVMKDGRMLCIEVKSATGRVMPHQRAFLLSIHQAGGVAFIARSVDDVIDRLGRE